MREFARRFYKSRAWQKVRLLHLSEHPYCERCLVVGKFVPATQVHHKIYLTPENIDDPSITLNDSNLESLCDTCHQHEHYIIEQTEKGFYFDSEGNLKPPGQ